MRSRLFTLTLLPLIAACSTNPKPKPPEPPPTPTPVCAEGQTTCCWHQPPGNEWLYACPAPEVPGGVLNVAGGPAQCPGQKCGGTTPPDPEPPSGDVPPVGTPVDTNEMLRLGGSTGYVTNGGQEIKPFGVEACCESWAKCPDDQGAPKGTGWPAVSACFVRETAKYGANIWHLRLSPWDSLCAEWEPQCGEPYWFGIGGTYNADGSFNMTYAAKIRELVADISQRGGWAEIVIGDDWWFKNACGKDSTDPNCTKRLPMSEAAVRAWGKTWHPEHDALFKFWIEQLGPFGRVIWATGNEEDLVSGTTTEHVQARVAAIRKYEQLVGAGLVHIVGTGSFKPGIEADYQITHENTPVTGPCNGRPCANNEHNPNVSAEEEADRYRKALEAKQRYDAWRAGGTDEDWEKRLELFQGIIGGTAPPVGCFAPPQEPEDQWETLGPGPGDRTDEIKAGQAALGSLCKEPKHHDNGDAAIEALAAKMREMGYCASKHSDSVTIQSEDDPSIWLEYHAVAPYDTGCWSQRPQDYPHNRHRYKGGGSTPVAGCSAPTPPNLHTFAMKLEATGWWNGTPIVKSHDYCVAIGMPLMPDGVQPRNECPCRDECPNVKCQERAACERAAMGGLATWKSDGELRVDETNENHLLAKCSSCTWIEVCNASGTVCRRSATNVQSMNRLPAEDPNQTIPAWRARRAVDAGSLYKER